MSGGSLCPQLNGQKLAYAIQQKLWFWINKLINKIAAIYDLKIACAQIVIVLQLIAQASGGSI